MPSAPKATAPSGSFLLRYSATTGACGRCQGLPTLLVVDDRGEVSGQVVADWPWNRDIPDDPEQHPSEPHYTVEWFGQDVRGRDLPGLTATDPYFVALAVHEHALSQAAG